MAEGGRPDGADDGQGAQPEGVDLAAVGRWLAAVGEPVDPPLAAGPIGKGRSNLTFEVTDAADRRWVLRRPPLGSVLETAHDVGREHRVMAALADAPVPVPEMVGHCDDLEVIGAPFFVMRPVDGVVAADLATAEQHVAPDARRRASLGMVEVLAALHAVDPDAVGLGDLGRREGYLERQLRRWGRQWDQQRTRDLPEVERVHQRLVDLAPEQGPAGIVHGDYRLDNVVLGADGEVRAVLDWELCTLGDVLADVGMLLVYWTRPGDRVAALPDMPTLADGFAERDELLERYARASGRDLSGVGYYQAFGQWKLAIILEGVLARTLAGAYGRHAGDVTGWQDHIAELVAAAADGVDRLG